MYHVVINPASRSGKSVAVWEKKIKPVLDAEGVEYQVYFSNATEGLAGVAASLEAAVETGDICCILLGGDGSLNQFLQGFQDVSRVIVGLICCGSGNDLARDLSLPKSPEKGVKKLLHEATVHEMDLGEVFFEDNTSRRFVTSLGIGFDAAVCDGVDRSKMKNTLNKTGLGKLIYLGVALKQLFGSKSVRCSLFKDDEPPMELGKTFFVAGMNHRYEGGGFKFCPKADCADGVLDLCVVRNLPRLVILLVLPTAFFGGHYIFPRVDAHRASSYRVVCDAPAWLHTDGETVRQTDAIRVECHQKALRMLY